VVDLVTSSDALHRVRQEAEVHIDAAIRELEAVELDGLRPTLLRMARSAVDRNS
jgi:hypothetical protein